MFRRSRNRHRFLPRAQRRASGQNRKYSPTAEFPTVCLLMRTQPAPPLRAGTRVARASGRSHFGRRFYERSSIPDARGYAPRPICRSSHDGTASAGRHRVQGKRRKAMNRRPRIAAVVTAVSLASATLGAQTAIKLPKNRYTPKQDVELGREAAAEVRRQYPIIRNEQIAGYLAKLGERLIAAAPSSLKESVYEYSFTPVNLKEINAFALPGGPMFVQRGMIEAAAEEAEVAGVMAHELSHVLLRHGTANVSKAQNPWVQLGQVAGAIGGAVVGGPAGS